MLQVVFIAIAVLMGLSYMFESVAGENGMEEPVTLDEMPTVENDEPTTAA